MRLSYVVFVPLLALSAQKVPDAARLLKERSGALEKYDSYQYVETMSIGRAAAAQEFRCQRV